MCFRPHELSGVLLPELSPTSQRENPAGTGIADGLSRGDPLVSQGPMLPVSVSPFLLSLSSMFSDLGVY